MIANLRRTQAILLFLLPVGLVSAEVPERDELRAALADLTTNIENVDDAGFQKASRVMVSSLSGVAESRFNYPADCLVWGKIQWPTAKPQDILLIAFMAGVTQERIYGDTKLALYRGWLNVSKYYQHYHADGTIEKLSAIEELIKMEKAGTLLAEAQKAQAKHPEVFDHLEIDSKGRDLANEYPWEGCGAVSLALPENWSVVGKQYGENAYTFLATPKSGSKAEMTLSLIQHAKKNNDEARELATKLEQAMTPLLAYSNEHRIATESLTMSQGIGMTSQLTGDALIGKLPIKLKHKVVRMAFCSLDEHCTLIAIMQMDAPDSREAAQMMSIVTGVAFRRSSQGVFLEVVEEQNRYVLTVPISNLRLSIPKGGLVEGPTNTGGLKNSPRYFYFLDSKQNLQVSGWLESDRGYRGLKDFWKAENQNDRLNAKSVSFEKNDPWELIFYETPLPEVRVNGKQGMKLTATHMRAEYTGAGTWIDLHCSIISASPGHESRAALLAFLQGLKIEGK